MAKVIMQSWQAGMDKISLTSLQATQLRIGLRDSKENVDLLLSGKEVVLEIAERAVAEDFFQQATKVGVSCRLILD